MRRYEQPARNADLAALDQAAMDINAHLVGGAGAAAGELALNRLIPLADDCRNRHNATTAAVPNVLWACGDAAVSNGSLELAMTLRLRAVLFAVVFDSLDQQREPVFPTNQMLQHAFQAGMDLRSRLEPLANAPAHRKLEMINDRSWPYLRSAPDLYQASIEIVRLLHNADDDGPRLLAIALSGLALDLEPFIPPHSLSGRIAAQEVRFWTGTMLMAVQYSGLEKAVEHIRTGIARLIEIERRPGAVDAGTLKSALDALKLSLVTTGYLSTVATLEMGFDGLTEIRGFSLEMPDDPIFQAARRTRIPLRGQVQGFGERLGLVLNAFDGEQPVDLHQMVQATRAEE